MSDPKQSISNPPKHDSPAQASLVPLPVAAPGNVLFDATMPALQDVYGVPDVDRRAYVVN